VRRAARFTPFGWNDEAARINHAYSRPSPHPPLEVVRRVNGRAFSADVEGRHWADVHCLGVVHSIGEVEKILDDGHPHEAGWVVKSEHGNGAFGNRRLRSRVLSDGDRGALERLFAEDESAVVEPWRERVLDLASVFEVDETGETVDFRVHEVLNTSDGALLGDVFDRALPAINRWGGELEQMAATVARELAGAGYFGPVCVDSFVWNDRGVERLRPVVDINARLFMAAAAERLWRSWDRGRVVSWRLLSCRKLSLPASYAAFESELGDAAFDPDTRCGVLLTSPLAIEGRRPKRLGVVLSGRDRDSVGALGRWFARRFAR
jgi:hypothetical protein